MGCCNSTSRRSPSLSQYDQDSGAPNTQLTNASRAPLRGTTGAEADGESSVALAGTAAADAAASATAIDGAGREGIGGRAEAGSGTAVGTAAAGERGASTTTAHQKKLLLLRIPPPQRCRKPNDTGVWNAARLHGERTAFWETRVTGRSEVWQGLRLVCELLHRGELAEAQAVLEAAGCVCPSGALWKGVYDERGQSYDVPAWLIGDPPGIVPEDGQDGSDSEKDDEEKAIAVSRAEEKGKGRAADIGEMVKVRARLSDRATDVVVKMGQKESVKALTQRVMDQAGIAKPGRVKIVYLGKVLIENETLLGQGWHEGHVVNALVFQ